MGKYGCHYYKHKRYKSIDSSTVEDTNQIPLPQPGMAILWQAMLTLY